MSAVFGLCFVLEVDVDVDRVFSADECEGLTQITFPTPKSLPAGDYLVRMEHIAVHNSATVGGAQL